MVDCPGRLCGSLRLVGISKTLFVFLWGYLSPLLTCGTFFLWLCLSFFYSVTSHIIFCYLSDIMTVLLLCNIGDFILSYISIYSISISMSLSPSTCISLCFSFFFSFSRTFFFLSLTSYNLQWEFLSKVFQLFLLFF